MLSLARTINWQVIVAVFIAGQLVLNPVYASHAHLDRGTSWWKPTSQVELSAPVLPDAAERLNEFASRNSDENIEKLAREFFGMINPNSAIMGMEKPGFSVMDDWGRYCSRPDSKLYGKRDAKSVGVRDLLTEKKYREALEMYKDRFFDRLANPPAGFLLTPVHPKNRIFMEFVHQPDELMKNVVTLFMYKKPQEDETLNGIVVKMNIGQPGAVNWTYTPEGYGSAEECLPDDERFAAYCYSHDYFFDQLLVAYVETGDLKYLEKYAAFLDDRTRNYWTDVHAAKLDVSPSSEGGVHLLKHMAWVCRYVPGFKENFPAPTLARVLLDFWKYNAASAVRTVRGAVPNRQVGMYLEQAFPAAASFPEFYPAAYVLREMVRIQEAAYGCDVMPDGSNIEHNTGYNYALVTAWKYWKQFREANVLPNRVNADWMLEYRDNITGTARYLAQNRALNGWDWYPMYYLPKVLKFQEIFPEAYADPAIRKSLPITIGKGPMEGLPNYTSVAWPYMGIYILRNGWDAQRSQECYMAAPRPYNTANWKNNLDLQLFGYGQPLLTAQTEGYGYRRGPGQTNWEKGFREEQIKKYNDPYRRGMHQWDFTPVFVDGCPQIDHAGFDSLPEDVQQGIRYRVGGNRAYYTPLPGRWHESEYFNIMEGTYDGEFAAFEPNPSIKITPTKGQKRGKITKLITDVCETRQVILLKKPGFWIIADRLKSPASHSYQLDWKFAQPWEDHGMKVPGFDRTQITFDSAKKAFITHNKETANLSLYMNSAREMEPYFKPETNHYGAEFSGAGAQLVVTAAFPREKDVVELKNYCGFSSANVAGFDAELPDGSVVVCRAANEVPGVLTAGPVSGRGEMLVYLKGIDGAERCFSLGMKSLSVNGSVKELPSESAEFVILNGSVSDAQPVRSPLGLVKIQPEADVFTDKLEISMNHEDPGLEIRYTVDGTDPTLNSSLYTQPFTASFERVVVKARAFRKGLKEIPECPGGTLAGDTSRAVYEKATPKTATKTEPRKEGLDARFTKGDGYLTAFTPMKAVEEKKTTATELFEGLRRDLSSDFAAEYTGFMVVPEDGVYTLHAPPELINNNFDGGYDLRVWLGEGKEKEEWYPATRVHNFGGWSVALKKGAHPIRILYVDQRGGNVMPSGFQWIGDHPTLEISGSGIQRRPIPKEWLRR